MTKLSKMERDSSNLSEEKRRHLPLISVIIPVYNAQKYIRGCIESVLSQDYPNFEILLIDDGATDASGAICDELSYNDDRIKVFHKKNGGSSSARNLGLMKAKGEWITFLDADDKLTNDALSSLLSLTTENIDFVIGDFDYTLHGIITEYYHPDCYERKEFIRNFISSDWVIICGSLIKRELFSKNDICFPESINFSEDFYTITKVLNAAKNIAHLNKVVYHYNRDNEDSVTHNPAERDNHQRKAFLLCLDYLSSLKDFELFEEGTCWKLLQAEQSIVLNKHKLKEFARSYPRKSKFIFSCPYISRKMKVMMWCILNKQSWLVKAIITLMRRS